VKICECCSGSFMEKRSTARFCSERCRMRSYGQTEKRRDWFRQYQRLRRATGKVKKYKRKRDPWRLAYYKAYYHSHKSDYTRRRREWLLTPKGKEKLLAKTTRRRLRGLSEREREMRVLLLEFKRWCRSNGYGKQGSVKRFLKTSPAQIRTEALC